MPICIFNKTWHCIKSLVISLGWFFSAGWNSVGVDSLAFGPLGMTVTIHSQWPKLLQTQKLVAKLLCGCARVRKLRVHATHA